MFTEKIWEEKAVDIKDILNALVLWLTAVNTSAVMMTCADKRFAMKGRRRISEKALFTAAPLGGAPGMYAAMRLIRHKTLHKRFMIGLPVIMVFHICMAAGVFWLYQASR